MKKAFLFFTLLTSVIFSSEKDPVDKNQKNSFVYIGVDTYGILPTIGAGYRYKKGHNGIDLLASVGLGAHARAMYLVYPYSQGLYLGVGGGAVYLPDYGISNSVTPSIEGSIGYQSKKHFFVQLNAVSPFKVTSKGFEAKIIPGITIGYGF